MKALLSPRQRSQLRRTPQRKEVIIMEYQKPQIVVACQAVSAIQGLGKIQGAPDNELHQPSAAAYEADE